MTTIGKLHLIIGPMYAGKSTELIRRINLYNFLGSKIMCINHIINNRYGSNNIITHNKNEIKDCVILENLNEIENKDINNIYKSANVIIIEEVQFFKNSYEYIKKMVEEDNKIVLAAGLISDFNREPIGDVLKLITLADTCEYVKALCFQCKDGTKAPFTKRKTTDTQKELVGSYSIYEAVCRYHYLYDD